MTARHWYWGRANTSLAVASLSKRATDGDVFVNASLSMMFLGSSNVDPTVMDRDQGKQE
jgi:hypothetical protein